MRFYKRKPKPLHQLEKNLKYSLEEPEHCKACQMELLPTRDQNGDIRFPKEFCDYKCEEIYGRYKYYIREGRIMADKAYIEAYYPHKDGLPRIDFTI